METTVEEGEKKVILIFLPGHANFLNGPILSAGGLNGPRLYMGKCFLHPIIFNLHPTYFLISKNTFYSENKNLKLKIIYFGKINPEVIIEFRK